MNVPNVPNVPTSLCSPQLARNVTTSQRDT